MLRKNHLTNLVTILDRHLSCAEGEILYDLNPFHMQNPLFLVQWAIWETFHHSQLHVHGNCDLKWEKWPPLGPQTQFPGASQREVRD